MAAPIDISTMLAVTKLGVLASRPTNVRRTRPVEVDKSVVKSVVTHTAKTNMPLGEERAGGENRPPC